MTNACSCAVSSSVTHEVCLSLGTCPLAAEGEFPSLSLWLVACCGTEIAQSTAWSLGSHGHHALETTPRYRMTPWRWLPSLWKTTAVRVSGPCLPICQLTGMRVASCLGSLPPNSSPASLRQHGCVCAGYSECHAGGCHFSQLIVFFFFSLFSFLSF